MDAFTRFFLLFTFVIFIPTSAACYYYSRSAQRRSEVRRYLKILNMKNADLFEQKHPVISLSVSVLFVTLLSICFWGLILFGDESGITSTPNYLFGGATVSDLTTIEPTAADGPNASAVLREPASPDEQTAGTRTGDPGPLDPKRAAEIRQANIVAYQGGALLTFNMAFLGAYLWGLQNIARRYTMNDLIPSAYYNLGVRMIFACILSLVFYHLSKMTPEFMASIFLDGPTVQQVSQRASGDGGTTHLLMPIIAFLIGFFPQRGLKWLTEKFSMFTQYNDPSVRDLPLEMIEGITIYDRVRLQELGISSCYDLANIDYVPYLFKSPYSPRLLINWILQAKLCVFFGEHVKDLRERGIHTVWQLRDYDEAELLEMAKSTTLTEDTLRIAREQIARDDEILRLIDAQLELSRYWNKENGEQRRHSGTDGSGKDDTAA